MPTGETTTSPIRRIAGGLRFPEGPVAMADGSVLLVEIRGGAVTRVAPDGSKMVVATPYGGPNGMAIGPDGAAYVCNNGGLLWQEGASRERVPDYTGGRIERIDLASGEVRLLYDHCGDRALSSPNDLVFDAFGGFYFSDIGKLAPEHRMHGSVYYAQADGSRIAEVARPMLTPNGVGLSPDGRILYVAETATARLWAFDIEAPGLVRRLKGPMAHGGRYLAGVLGLQRFDSLAVDAEGNICVATLVSGRIHVFAPDGALVRVVETGDDATTNICFGGPERRTAFLTLAGGGELAAMTWPCPGLKLNFGA